MGLHCWLGKREWVREERWRGGCKPYILWIAYIVSYPVSVQVNSEEVSLESLAKASEQLCCPDIIQRKVMTWQSNVCLLLMIVVPAGQMKYLSGVIELGHGA